MRSSSPQTENFGTKKVSVSRPYAVSKPALKVYVDVGYGNALYLVGADPKLGEWKNAIRMQIQKPSIWVFEFDAALVDTEFKFLKGAYDLGENVSVDQLFWEKGDNRKLATDSNNVYPHSFEEPSKNQMSTFRC